MPGQSHDARTKAGSLGLTETGLGLLVGRSPAMCELQGLMLQVGPSSASVLIVGESGVGKELVARTLHALSPRSEGPFVGVNCAAIPETLLEAELFGHERGAFTGAEARRAGCFELANHGTLFLDEMSLLPPASQAKLLRVLEERSFRRLRGAEEIKLDVRVLAAMGQDPELALRRGEVRADLYYRLNVFTLRVPALRERLEELPLLVEHFVRELGRANGKRLQGASPAVLEALERYPWPGNVRELRNVVERAVILAADGGEIGLEELPPHFLPPSPTPLGTAAVEPTSADGVAGTPTLEATLRDLILRTLAVTGNNKTQAAKLLGISTRTIYNKLRAWSLPLQPAAHENQ